MTFRELCFRCTNIVNFSDVRIFEEGKKGFREEKTWDIIDELGEREVDWFTVTGLNSVDVAFYSEDE